MHAKTKNKTRKLLQNNAEELVFGPTKMSLLDSLVH